MGGREQRCRRFLPFINLLLICYVNKEQGDIREKIFFNSLLGHLHSIKKFVGMTSYNCHLNPELSYWNQTVDFSYVKKINHFWDLFVHLRMLKTFKCKSYIILKIFPAFVIFFLRCCWFEWWIKQTENCKICKYCCWEFGLI